MHSEAEFSATSLVTVITLLDLNSELPPLLFGASKSKNPAEVVRYGATASLERD